MDFWGIFRVNLWGYYEFKGFRGVLWNLSSWSFVATFSISHPQEEGDELKWVRSVKRNDSVILSSQNGQTVRCEVGQVWEKKRFFLFLVFIFSCHFALSMILIFFSIFFTYFSFEFQHFKITLANQIRLMGRKTRGVSSMVLSEGDQLAAMDVLSSVTK